VAEELHISRAAEKLDVAQPAVSEQIRKLERDLGVELLDRTRRRIALTDAGVAFLAEARRVLEDAEHARLAARSAQEREGSRGPIGLSRGCSPLRARPHRQPSVDELHCHRSFAHRGGRSACSTPTS